METKYIVTLVVALGGWIFAAVMYWLSYRERQATRKEDQLFRTLAWFEGHTQKRSIGIAVTEAYWKDSPRSRTILIPLLGNQAIYLLAVSKQGTAHERNNLERIMGLITDYAPLKSKFSHLAKELAELTSPDSTRRGKTGNTVSDEKLTKWNKVLK
jgi:hypothetical protein